MTEQPQENPQGQPATPGYPAVAYPTPPTKPPSKTMAIVALVLAIFGFPGITAIAAIVLAIIVLTRLRTKQVAGKGMAISAIIVSVLWLAFLVAGAIVTIADEADRDDTGSLVKGGSESVFSLRKGDCMKKTPADAELLSVDVTPCDSPHRAEVYATFKLNKGAYPGSTEVIRLAEGGCIKRFDAFVGRSYDESSLELMYLHPLKASWKLDREVSCLLTTDTVVKGSLRDSKK